MPVCRTREDLHPPKYEAIWNGAISKQQQTADQRLPPPKTNHVWAITKADELDIFKHMRTLGTFSLYDLDTHLEYEYAMSALQRLVTKCVRENKLLKLVRGTGERQRYKYLVDQNGQQNLFGGR